MAGVLAQHLQASTSVVKAGGRCGWACFPARAACTSACKANHCRLGELSARLTSELCSTMPYVVSSTPRRKRTRSSECSLHKAVEPAVAKVARQAVNKRVGATSCQGGWLNPSRHSRTQPRLCRARHPWFPTPCPLLPPSHASRASPLAGGAAVLVGGAPQPADLQLLGPLRQQRLGRHHCGWRAGAMWSGVSADGRWLAGHRLLAQAGRLWMVDEPRGS